MTKKDFFMLATKLFGLSSLVASLSVIPRYINWVFTELDVTAILWLVGSLTVIIGLFVLLLFKAEKIVRMLRLDKGFDDDQIQLGNLRSADIIKLGTFIIGGLLFLDNVPDFLSHSLFAFKAKNTGIPYDNNFNWAVSIINLIIGYLLLTNYDFVAEKMKNKPENEIDPPHQQ